jgi:hypothetical protein
MVRIIREGDLTSVQFPVQNQTDTTALFEKYGFQVLELTTRNYVAIKGDVFVPFMQYGDGCIGAISMDKCDMVRIVQGWTAWNHNETRKTNIFDYTWQGNKSKWFSGGFYLKRLDYSQWEIEEKLKRM